MKKQGFVLTFALTFTFCTYLVGTPMRVNASNIIIGGSEDSSSSSGDNFNPVNAQPPVEPAPGVNVKFNGNGRLNIPIEVQNRVNATVANILSQSPATNSPSCNIIVILLGGSNAEAAANQLQASIASLGVSSSSVGSLVNALLGLAGNKSATALCAPVGILQPVQLFTSTKGLTPDLVIAQKGETPNVDINQLNNAITAYNNIVMESSPKVLQKLAKDPQFLEVGKLLKQLRYALNKS
ncbi:hypothetical protein LC608_12655 [Nostoc sp. XA010]|uniref:hypothetical protein n=1 Tax=Nostoc sp. XA010 TaxID=2780407 RepID=UPI001E3CB17D|nr:hypothetical protein [Nostoc sp. XA010]MCC5657826.1 hypothetical protein [Nostoc sp. XA010]